MEGSFTLPREGSTSDPLRIAVLISGGGSGLASILSYESLDPDFSTLFWSWPIRMKLVV